MSSSIVVQFYRTVIDDVISNVRDNFLDEGVDEQVLLELKQVWESKLVQSKAVPTENEASGREAETSSAADSSKGVRAAAPVATATGSAITTSSGPVTSTPNVQYQFATTTAGAHGGNEAPKTVTIMSDRQTAGGKPVTITLPAHFMQNSQAGGIIMSASAAAAAQALPPGIAAGLLQSQLTRVITQQQPDGTTVSYQAVTAEQLAKQGYVVSMAPRPGQAPTTTVTAASSSSNVNNQSNPIIQLDGANDTSDDEDDDDDLRDDDNDPDDDDDKNDDNEGVVEEEVDSDPLNSEDDVSDEDPQELFETDNVIVCQYDKITRSRNKWKFHLKDGIMNIQGKDYIFQKAIGDAEW